MAATIREVGFAGSSGPDGTHNFTVVPNPTDVLVVFGNRAPDSNVGQPAPPTGLGADWELVGFNSTTGCVVWLGQNPDATAGLVTTPGPTRYRAFLVAGVTSPGTHTFEAFNATGSPTDSPAVGVQAGQFVVGTGGGGFFTEMRGLLPSTTTNFPSSGTGSTDGTWNNWDLGGSGYLEWVTASPVAADVTTYRYRVTHGGVWVTPGCAIAVIGAVPPPAPGVPTDVEATADVDTVALDWAAPAAGGPVTGYDVRLDGGAATAVGAVLSHTFADLAPATAYAVAVRATGPGGVSDWVSVNATTLTGAAYRVVVRLGAHTWDANAGDPPELGPILPVSFGWAVPEDALGFPAQPDPDIANLELVTADHTDMAGVDIGTTMRVSFYTSTSATARPLATFRGRVADLEASPHPLGLSWRVLGVGYTADPSGRQVGTTDWPQESGDARAARIMAEAGYPGWAAPAIGTTLEARQAAATDARAALEALTDAAVTTEGTAFGPSRRVLFHPVTDADGDLDPASPFRGAAVLRRVDALDTVTAGLVNRRTSWRRTKLLDATWVRIDHPGGPTTYGDTRGPAYPPQSVSVTDPAELADLILDTTPGYRWLTGQPLRLELWADDGPALAVVAQWFYRDPASPPFPWAGRAVLVRPIANSPDGTDTYAGMLTAATMRLEHAPGAGGRLVVEFRLRPDIPAQSTVTMRWMDEPAGATWADELATDPDGTWYDYYTTPRP